MKKIIFSLLIALLYTSSSVYAEENYTLIEIHFHHGRIKDGQIIIMHPRSPADNLTIFQNDHIILFGTTEFCNSVALVDPCTEEVVYEMQVDATESLVTLPTYLEGEYEIRFMRDTYYYYGFIVL